MEAGAGGRSPSAGWEKQLNGFLTVWAGDEPIFEVEKPSFSNGVYTFQSGTTPPVVQISAESRMVALKVTLQDSAQMVSAE